MTDTGLETLRRSLRRQAAEEEKATSTRAERGWALARQSADTLREEFGASRVAVYGSLLDRERFHLRADVDLVAWDVRDYFHAVSRLLDLDAEIEVNLVPYEDAFVSLRETVAREGVEL